MAKRIPIGVQLYSVREDCAKDLPGTLAAIAKMGYEGVEFAGYHGYSAKDLRRLLDDNGLKCCGTHIGIDALLGDELARTVEFNQTLGNKFLIVPWLPEQYTRSRQAWLDTAKLFNELAEKVKPHGMRVGYHNHTHEFHPLDGELARDTFFGNTVKDVVMQFDTGNAMHAGAKAAEFLRKYPGRAATVHLKEFSQSNPNAVLGEGDIHWQEIFELCETIGETEWYIVEQETYAHPPLKTIELCLQNLKRMGK